MGRQEHFQKELTEGEGSSPKVTSGGSYLEKSEERAVHAFVYRWHKKPTLSIFNRRCLELLNESQVSSSTRH